jgi:transcription elongation factor Elf1
MTNANLSNDSIDLLCNHCGQTFSAFLHQMADRNAKVVCPNCGGNNDCKPPQAAKPVAGARPVKKTIQ